MPLRTKQHETICPLGDPLLRNTIMAVIDTSRSANVSNGGFAVISSLYATFAGWNDARQTRNSLNKLTDRELEDIGLVRGDIEDIAAKAGFR
jgi:uncharacterized protein YjiS (DUF1127 family)